MGTGRSYTGAKRWRGSLTTPLRRMARYPVVFTCALLVSLAALPVSPAGAADPTVPDPPVSSGSGAFLPGPHLTPLVPPGGQAGSIINTSGPHLYYYGGRVVSNIKVVQVLWGSGTYSTNVSSTTTPSIATMYQQVSNSAYFSWLTEYDRTTQRIGYGSFAGQYKITPSSTAHTISDATIQTELTKQIVAHNLPRPTHDAGGRNDTYYSIFFPHGDIITQGGTRSCVAGGFAGYHGTIAQVGTFGEVYYGVQPDFSPGSGCDNGVGGGTQFQNEMSVATHELVETVTDPQVGLAVVVGPPMAWYDPNNGEIGDICNAQQGSIVGADKHTYTVQKLWSNSSLACIVHK